MGNTCVFVYIFYFMYMYIYMYSVCECTFWSDILCTLHMYFVSDSSAASDSTSHQVLHGYALPAGVVQAAAGHEEVLI